MVLPHQGQGEADERESDGERKYLDPSRRKLNRDGQETERQRTPDKDSSVSQSPKHIVVVARHRQQCANVHQAALRRADRRRSRNAVSLRLSKTTAAPIIQIVGDRGAVDPASIFSASKGDDAGPAN